MAAPNNTFDAMLNERDVARLTGLSVATIRRRRLFRQPPKYYKLGSAVKYKSADVEAWINSQPTGGTETAGR
jgi:predicted DNA-binding transcriptional regulator AlpA